ncbi:MAG TPA: Ku protein [Gemmatimonadales bacterium]|jgi:DNA end-binding protein Ku|nr:Ku protein [Gemmatimonadales bacterium]
MARGIWKGTLGFGLVSVGVELFTAEASAERLDLDLLDRRDNARIRYRKVNEATGKEVSQENIVKGYPVEKGKYVVLSDADLKAANPKATQTVDIVGFVPRDAIEPVYYAKPYYVAPLKGSEKAYALLREALRRTEQLAVAQIVIRTRQYVAAVYPLEAVLLVHLLRYHDELKDLKSEEVAAAKLAAKALRPQELAMAEQLIQSMAMEWDPTQFSDTFKKDILKLVKEKARGGVRKAPAVAEEERPQVLDLMAALKRSVASREKSETRPKRVTERTRTSKRKPA